MNFAEYVSPFGTLLLSSNGTQLTGARFDRQAPEELRDDAVLAAAKLWLDSYFRGECQEPEFPLLPEGTAFQQKVWEHLLRIPFGQAVTYGSLAKQISENMSAQAVGQAVGKNPIAIIIPCHRCVGAGGQLTGYAWGIERKRQLLEHEQKGRA